MKTDIVQRRFESLPTPNPAAVTELADDHFAILLSEPLFERAVVPVQPDTNIFVSGHNNRKIGKVVTKGAWKGMPIFMLTLPERKTCPAQCVHWKTCFVPETRVLTADLRWVPIGELEVGHRIVAFDEEKPPTATGRLNRNNHRQYRVATVDALGRATKPVYRVATSHGEATATGDHLWLVKQNRAGYGWVRTDALRPGDEIRFFAKPWQADLSYEGGRVRGFVEGEGYATTYSDNGYHKARTGWGQRPGKLFEEINALVRARGFEIAERKVNSGVNDSEVMHAEIRGGWRETLRFLGTFRPTRLIEKAEEFIPGHSLDGCSAEAATVKEVIPAGKREIVKIATSTQTLIAEGFLAHNCYGNAMPFARRHEAGPALEARIREEIARLATRYPQGFVIRLHVLGDFYSVPYVLLWGDMLKKHPQLHVYGYTGRGQGDDVLSRGITLAISRLKKDYGQRFAIRWSMPTSIPDGTVVIDRRPEGANVAEGLVCPAEREATACCATCGLCWEAPDKTIVFARHGMGSDSRDSLIESVSKIDERGLRAVVPIPGLAEVASSIKNGAPKIVWVAPTDLYVDEAYQRNLSRNSLSLISGIVRGFSWANYKPPIVAWDKRSKHYHVTDGQHTAIACASHPDLKKIPCLEIMAEGKKDRARSFIAHNRDRIAVTPTQMHYSNIIAGDPEAIEISEICGKAGVTILKGVGPGGYNAGDTTALGSIRALLRAMGSTKTTRVLKVLAKAEVRPVRSDQIRAIAKLLFAPEYEGEFGFDEVGEVLKDLPHEQIRLKARDLASTTAQRNWEALATVYAQAVTRARRRSTKANGKGNGRVAAHA